MPKGGRFVPLRLLLVADAPRTPVTVGVAHALLDELRSRTVEVVAVATVADALAILRSENIIHCVAVDWGLHEQSGDAQAGIEDVLRAVRVRDARLPIVLTTGRSQAITVEANLIREVDEIVWMAATPPAIAAGRIESAMQRYCSSNVPPLSKLLKEFSGIYECAWLQPALRTAGI